jgi:hypothetical protein
LGKIAYSRWLSEGAYSLLNRVAILFFAFFTIFFHGANHAEGRSRRLDFVYQHYSYSGNGTPGIYP